MACVAAVPFPFPNAREREENCERVPKLAVGGGGVLTPGVLLRSSALRSLVRSPRRLEKERNQLLRRLGKQPIV